jgi:cytidylate kinase
MAGTITISASYGAEGAPIGREIAQLLGVEFFDRAIPVAVAQKLAVEPEEAISKDWHAPKRMERVLAALASTSMPYIGMDAHSELFANPDAFRQATEAVLRQIADGAGGVILGRASMVVLEKRPDVLSVRLDGPTAARIRRGIESRDIDEAAARKEQKETDTARESYLQTFYGRSQSDVSLYQVVLDSTVLSHQACIDIILRAAQDRLGLTANSAQ